MSQREDKAKPVEPPKDNWKSIGELAAKIVRGQERDRDTGNQ